MLSNRLIQSRRAFAASLILPGFWLSLPAQAQSNSARVANPVIARPGNTAAPGLAYVIGAGDVLQINVFKEPEASVASVVVRSDGVISLPLLKEVHASGLTPQALQKQLTQGLATLIRDPDVTVIVKEIHSERVFVIGSVRKEGPVELTGPCTILQILSESGGFTDYAKRSKIYVLRQTNGKQVRIPFDYSAAIKGERPEQNIWLQPGDTVVVP